MKVMIFVCGEGLGHASRCISIGKELNSAGHEVHFGAYGYSKELIERNGFITHKIPSEITLAGKAGALNMKKSILVTFKRGQFLGLMKLRKLLKKNRPDVVISDSYYMGLIGARARDIPCYLILNQSNMEEFFKGKGVSSKILGEIVKKFYTGMFKLADGIIIPDYPLPNTVCRKNLKFKKKNCKKVFFSGPLVGRSFEGTEAAHLSRPHVLCTIGSFGYREPIFRKVIEAANMDDAINYTLLSGPSIDPSDFGAIPENVHILRFIDDQFPYMKASDVIVAPGGHSTMMEALSFGIPMITVPDRNHSEQQNNASVIEDEGLGRKLDYSASPREILENIRLLIDNEKYRNKLLQMREMAAELNGAAGVRMKIEEMFAASIEPGNHK
ncbi:glycosyltransferase [Methanolobus psychrotolerans]|uniref:glycosyltransferase n=1 Tax=Methanolobus psychrotolerans TaxID=1874706 RepID=UPI000B919AC1|nr:glycosyltransferase [Methanolobus psychrotolerans]